MPAQTQYDADFFDDLAEASRTSAAVVVPLVQQAVGPRSVLDVGCGSGEWLAAWRDAGLLDMRGVDGDYVPASQLRVPPELFHAADLTRQLELGRQFDLVTSLEVAEHLDIRFADVLVDNLVRHSETILFSAAIPGQGGTHHVNCQWPSWWAEKFRARGYEVFDVIRPRVWDDPRVAPWYRQNMLLFARGPRRESLRVLAGQGASPLDIVHPEMFEAVANPTSLRAHLTPVRALVLTSARRRLRRLLGRGHQ